MAATHEQIDAALFALMQSSLGFKTYSRVMRDPAKIDPAYFPIAFLEATTESVEVESEIRGLPATWRLTRDISLFMRFDPASEEVGQETIIPAQTINAAVDSLIQALAVGPNQYQTLGNLVQHAWIEGKVLRAAGATGSGTNLAMAVVPVSVLAIFDF